MAPLRDEVATSGSNVTGGDGESRGDDDSSDQWRGAGMVEATDEVKISSEDRPQQRLAE